MNQNFESKQPAYADPSSETFKRSLDVLTPYDIVDQTPAPTKKGRDLSGILRTIALIVASAVFIGATVVLINNLRAKNRSVDLYDQIAHNFMPDSILQSFEGTSGDTGYYAAGNLFNMPGKGGGSAPILDYAAVLAGLSNSGGITVIDSYNAEVELMKAQITALLQENPDVYGWLYVEELGINYPVVQSGDNEYYLRRAFDGEYNPSGTLFVDWRCGDNLADNLNTVIYGHNLTNGTMFGNVSKFFDRETFMNTKIYFFTLDGAFVYEPVSIFQTISSFPYFRSIFQNTDDFLSFAHTMQDKSEFSRDYTFTEDDRLLTFSTCSLGTSEGRYAFHARLVSILR